MRSFVVDRMTVEVHPTEAELGRAAAADAARVLRDAIARAGHANAMFATGNSQRAFLDALVVDDVDWDRVVGFHMDEYVGIAAEHPASFRRYLRERLVERVHPQAFHYVDGDAPDPGAEARRYAGLLAQYPLDLCCLGIGENGHLAFNDPPVADFDDPVAVKVVRLDDACRHQQVGEGHFPSLETVPPEAITVTIPALLAARRVLAIVPEARKREPVATALHGPVTTDCPASILRTRPNVVLYLDERSGEGIGP